MRGDSLRDFYAKTLALMGLGVLAGAGALVDYWPVGVRIATVAPALELPESATELSTPAASPVVMASAPARMAPRLQNVSLIPIEIIARTSASMDVADALPVSTDPTFLAVAEPVSESVVAIAGPEIEPLALVDAVAEPADVTLVALADPVQADPFWQQPYALADSRAVEVDEEEKGLISGALKKTSTSIMRTGARTGASILDAVRVVGGAVRRALPDWRPDAQTTLRF